MIPIIASLGQKSRSSGAISRILARSLATIRNLVKATPIVSDFYLHYYVFPRRTAACRGLYGSYTDAQTSGAKIARLGYSDEGILPPEIIGEPEPMRRRDYPILFWLAPALTEGTKILNLGGNAGAEFFTYRQFLPLPNQVRWLVWDLPHAVSVGQKLADLLDAPGLSFTLQIDDAEVDVVITCGAIQYFEHDLAFYLRRLRRLPARVFVNRVPLYEGDTFFTLQNVVNSVVPYRIQNRQELVDFMRWLGYRLVDCWCEDHEIVIPFHPERKVDRFYGFYFLSNDEAEPEWRTRASAVARQVREFV